MIDMPSTECDPNNAFEVLKSYLTKHSWQYERVEGHTALSSSGSDDICPIIYYFQIVKNEQFLFYIKPVLTLIPEMLPSVVEFIARANFGMRIGNFELDYQSSQICFRSSINFNGTPLTDPLIGGAISPALEAYAEFFPGLANVIAGVETPKQAINRIEYSTE